MTLGTLLSDCKLFTSRKAILSYMERHHQNLDSPAPYFLINRVLGIEFNSKAGE